MNILSSTNMQLFIAFYLISAVNKLASVGCMSILCGAATTDDIPVAMSINVKRIPVLSRNGKSVNTEKLE